MKTQEIIGLFDQFVIGNYARLPIAFVRGDGSHLWDADGKRYLDLFPGWGVNGLGHCHPNVVAAVRQQAGRLMHVANNFYMEPQGILAKLLSERAFGGKCFFCNSGAEANEGALKLARLAEAGGRYKVITFDNSFHGRTFAAITATGQEKYHRGLGPLMPGFSYAAFGDMKSVERLVDAETCAIMVEPIQGEGGVNVPPEGFLRDLRALCNRHGMLLIFDEVQTGCGRTGTWFGYQQEGIEPDIMTLAKALGGGLAVGAMIARATLSEKLAPGTHASTFGGNPMACAAAIATIETIESEKLLDHARHVGEHALARMRKMQKKFSFIVEARGRGCMLGLELNRPGKDVVRRCMERGVLINCTHDTVLRMLPAMNVPLNLLDVGLDILEEALSEEGK